MAIARDRLERYGSGPSRRAGQALDERLRRAHVVGPDHPATTVARSWNALQSNTSSTRGMLWSMPVPHCPGTATPLTAARFLRRPRSWLLPSILLSVVIFALTIVFAGSVANPQADLHDAPIGLVSLDQGTEAGGTRQNLGTQVVEGIKKQKQDPQGAVQWKQYDSLADVRSEIGGNKLFAAVVLPKDYSGKIISLTGQNPQRPVVTVLTNHGAGSMASSIGNEIAETAARNSSAYAGSQVLQHAQQTGAKIPSANAALLSDPITVTQEQGVPLGDRTGRGMTAFFYAVLLMMIGFLGANVINGLVDADLGFNASEVGPVRQVNPPQLISRRETLLAKCLTLFIASVPTATAILAAGTLVLDLDLPHAALLWVFSIAGITTIGIGTLVVLSLFGAIGTVAAMVFFVAGAIPVSSGAVPLQAMPSFWQFLGEFAPMRALVDGVRAIIYFDAQGSAGLTRGVLLLGTGLLVSLLLGFTVSTLYDRKGLHRIHPHAIPRIRDFLHNGHHLHQPTAETAEATTPRNGGQATSGVSG
ncbi:DUF3533 domain-containing protein [Streptomyces sp. CA-135486]|uniref:DUF3533 domain-containing protein n=1 Tax=Streptomyces sp. CA-135486 TaxID=3240049 RepID=UPI003D9404A8